MLTDLPFCLARGPLHDGILRVLAVNLSNSNCPIDEA